MTGVRYTEGTAQRIRIDGLLDDHRVHNPGRFTRTTTEGQFGVLYLEGLTRDLAEGLEVYRYGLDFAYMDSYDRALDVALRYHNTDMTAGTFGRGEHYPDDLAFWRQQLPEGLPRFFSAMVVGITGQLAIAGGWRVAAYPN
jgi:hypothetical protein